MWYASLFLVLGTLLAACSGRTDSASDAASAAGLGGSRPILGDAAGGSGEHLPADDPANFACPVHDNCEPLGDREGALPRPECPVEEPEEGGTCDQEQLVCSYGSSVTAYCRSYFQCRAGEWGKPENLQNTCISQPDGFCEATPADGTACVVGEVDAFVPCEYPGGITCYCVGNPPRQKGAKGAWECYAPPRNAACPESLPNLGEGCRRNGQVCHYGMIQQGCFAPYADVYCFRGAWAEAPATCLL